MCSKVVYACYVRYLNYIAPILLYLNRRQKLIYELNSSGKYFAFKEQLKHSVVKIVREKYLKTSGFDDRQELQVCHIDQD